MTRCLVTGVAGFIGSHLAERLLAEGYEVIGVDCFTDYYPRSVKEANLRALRERSGFRFLPLDLRRAKLAPLLDGVSYVFHQAAQAGVRASWGAEFELYVEHNVLATQRLLEAVKDGGSHLRRFVFASSSSVYGNVKELPVREDCLPRPYSPYGVTKLAAEHLCMLYHRNFGLPTISLRYFTVYGPRQRPDMAFHRFIRRMLHEQPLEVYGDGEQTRDFTFVSDAVEANLLAMEGGLDGETYNIGGGSRVTVNEAIRMLERITGKSARIVYRPPQHGDVQDTWADTSRARAELGFRPEVSLEEGLRAEVEWLGQQLMRGAIHPTELHRPVGGGSA